MTVKCRIGVDDQDPEQVLPDFLEKVSAAGVSHFIIHARKAWLKGLSPKENREIPPLDYGLVHRMKAAFPHLTICINGGITTLPQAKALLDQGLDGVMIGRAAYHDPATALIGADALWGDDFAPDPFEVLDAMRPYIADHLAAGGRLHQITRHMLGLFQGRPGRARLAAGAVRRLGWRAGHAGRRPGPGSGGASFRRLRLAHQQRQDQRHRAGKRHTRDHRQGLGPQHRSQNRHHHPAGQQLQRAAQRRGEPRLFALIVQRQNHRRRHDQPQTGIAQRQPDHDGHDPDIPDQRQNQQPAGRQLQTRSRPSAAPGTPPAAPKWRSPPARRR